MNNKMTNLKNLEKIKQTNLEQENSEQAKINELILNLNKLKDENNLMSILAKYTLDNFHLIPKLNLEDFITLSYSSKPIVENFLTHLNFFDYETFAYIVSLYLRNKITSSNLEEHQDKHLIQKFHNQLLRSLELNYFCLIKNSNLLNEIVQVIKQARKIYFFTNKVYISMLEPFVNTLNKHGFKMQIVEIINFHLFQPKLNPKDVCFIILNEFKYQNFAQLNDDLKWLNNNLIWVGKYIEEELNYYSGLKFDINYWFLPRISNLNSSLFSILFLFEIILQKILLIMKFSHKNIIQKFLDSQENT